MTSIDDLVVYRSAAQKSVSLDKLYIVDLNITGFVFKTIKKLFLLCNNWVCINCNWLLLARD